MSAGRFKQVSRVRFAVAPSLPSPNHDITCTSVAKAKDGNSMVQLVATQSVLDFGSRGYKQGEQAFSRVWLIASVWMSMAAVEKRGGGGGEDRDAGDSRARIRGPRCRVWIAKDFIVMNLIFVQTVPFHRAAPPSPSGTRRTERYVPMQTCCTEYLEEGSPCPLARVPYCVPAGYP